MGLRGGNTQRGLAIFKEALNNQIPLLCCQRTTHCTQTLLGSDNCFGCVIGLFIITLMWQNIAMCIQKDSI